MAFNVTTPDARTLLPPLLACLPTAFVSPHPPPALLPQLSPILRQRVSLLSGNTSSGNGGWLSLLSWDPQRASKLGEHLEGVQFEAHPVSGELELEDVDIIQYRQLDQETLQSRFQVSEFNLLPLYVWVQNDDQNNGTGPGWKLAELRVLEDKEDGTEWYDSLSGAMEAASFTARKPLPTPMTPVTSTAAHTSAANQQRQQVYAAPPPAPAAADEDDDDDYWASYDRTPGRTPARTPVKHSPAPTAARKHSTNIQVGPTAEELEYFARYASEVQPALDSHDPDEEMENGDMAGESTLQGGEFTRPVQEPVQQKSPLKTDEGDAMAPAEVVEMVRRRQEEVPLEAPRATSPSSQGSVERLERAVSAGEGGVTRAEVGVRQFISTGMKSMYRLARSVGMDRADFEEMVQRELEVLGFMEQDD